MKILQMPFCFLVALWTCRMRKATPKHQESLRVFAFLYFEHKDLVSVSKGGVVIREFRQFDLLVGKTADLLQTREQKNRAFDWKDLQVQLVLNEGRPRFNLDQSMIVYMCLQFYTLYYYTIHSYITQVHDFKSN